MSYIFPGPGTGTGALVGQASPTITGALTITGGTVTASTPAESITQTWNSGGVTFTGFLVNVTDTASASGSLLMDLQVAASSKFQVSKAGGVTIAGSLIQTAGSIQANSGGFIGWGSRALMDSPADGRIRLGNNAFTSFTSLEMMTSASNSVGWYIGSGTPEGAVTARVGSKFSRTDGGASTSFYVKESGTGNTGWVAK